MKDIMTTEEIKNKRITVGDEDDLKFLRSKWFSEESIKDLVDDFADFRMPFRYKQRLVNEWKQKISR